jgi:hypothetical protein
LECLEDRRLPAIFLVENGLDSGVGSLRAAITAANDETNNPGADTIEFAPGVTVVTLTSAQLTLASDITITGGTTGVTIARDEVRPRSASSRSTPAPRRRWTS